METLDRTFADVSVRRLRLLASRIDACLDRLNEDQVWMREADSQNAAGNLVLHLCGNLGQWISTGVGGAPDTRDRDAEFEARGGVQIPELKQRLKNAVEAAAGVIEGVSAERMGEVVRVQSYDVTVLEAIYHVVEHFAQHTGQIIFATKLFTREELGFYTHLRKQAHGEKTP